MRKAFFFFVGLIAASVLVLIFSDDNAISARIRRPRLYATVWFPAPKDSEQLPSVFSHTSHARFGYKKCSLCHNDEVFAKDQDLGVNNINMDEIYEGKWCGHCHNGKLLTKDEDGDEVPVFAPIMQNVNMCVLCHSGKIWKKPDPAKAWKPPAGIKPAEGLPDFLKK
jgi:c(7)-type cytochrome triheme protein